MQLIKGATARGKVIDAKGRPLAGATVKLGMPRFDARYGMSKAAQTGRDGTFELTNLPSGGWLVEAELPHEPGALRPPIVYYPGVLRTGEASFIELVPGRTTDDVTIVAPRLADNKLTVRVVTLEQLIDLDVAFVRVEPLVSRKVTLDDSGTATINGMIEGRYFLTARGRSDDRNWAAQEVVEFAGGEQECIALPAAGGANLRTHHRRERGRGRVRWRACRRDVASGRRRSEPARHY
ncbi:MAG: carboxypeptidase-like regulatory domain-containing protein [Hymenobacter sp.]